MISPLPLVSPTALNVGIAIKTAIEHAKEHERLCSRKLTVRIQVQRGDYCDGLSICATIAARTQSELENNTSTVVQIPWEHLDARVHELTTIIDACVAEIETRFGMRNAA